MHIDKTGLHDTYEASKNFMYAKYSPKNILDISELVQHETNLHSIERADKNKGRGPTVAPRRNHPLPNNPTSQAQPTSPPANT